MSRVRASRKRFNVALRRSVKRPIMGEKITVRIMEKHYYDASSLRGPLDVLERRFKMSSADFLEAHKADDPAVAHLSRFVRHTWASFYLDWLRLDERGDDFGAHVGRELELV